MSDQKHVYNSNLKSDRAVSIQGLLNSATNRQVFQMVYLLNTITILRTVLLTYQPNLEWYLCTTLVNKRLHTTTFKKFLFFNTKNKNSLGVVSNESIACLDLLHEATCRFKMMQNPF